MKFLRTLILPITGISIANVSLAAPLDYNRDIRPIISENCFACHGFDEKSREAELRMDVQASAYAERNGVTPLKPGDLKKSEAWLRITSTDKDVQMPPPKSHLKLTACLLARRLLERNTRFVELFHRGWDQHIAIARQLPNQCNDVDQPTAALIKDLKQRGLLDDTLVIFATEFGRTVFSQGKLEDPGMGRDHHGRCFSIWLAGGGIKPGMEFGAIDDFCYNIAENPVHVRDLHATILHCLGIDHQRFTHKFRGLNTRLTGVEEAHVVKGILA